MFRTLLVLAALLVVARPAGADPRWWWNDLRLTDTPADSITPHIVTPGYATGGAGVGNVFVTWSEIDPAQGDQEVWMTASFNGGCSFCVPTRLTDDADDDVTPRIAVLALPEGTWSIQVIFASTGTGETVIAWDSTHVSYRVPQDQLCPQIEALGATIRALDQFVRFGGIDAEGRHPDIAAAGTMTWGHFHATWQETTLGGPVIAYAHDLTARGGDPGWRMHPVRTWGPGSPIVLDVRRPRVAVDTATDPDPLTGNTTNDRSGVTLVYEQVREAGPAAFAELVSLRSTDSGATFSATGARADGPPGVVPPSVLNPADGVTGPEIDAAHSSFSTTDPAWTAAAWNLRDASGSTDVRVNQRFVAEPARPAPDWDPAGQSLASPLDDREGSPAVALQFRFTNPAPAWFAWTQRVAGVPEIVSRAGMLSAATDPPLDLSAYPIAPVRPLDSAVSRDAQLTHCAFDEATFACPPTRTAGDASEVSMDASESGVFAVWTDRRDGNAEIYFKRTDEYVSGQAPVLAAGCGPAGDAYIDVTFPLLDSCPQSFSPERMLRYRIYWRRDAASPYENAAAPVEILHAAEPGPNVTRRIAGLLPGTTYRVIVVPEDEARNLQPADFDPRVAPAMAPFNEATADTPSPCAVAEPCLWRADVTSVAPHVPARDMVYLVPPSADDIHLQGAAYDCPVAPGDLEPDGNAYVNGIPLVMYQVNRPVGTLKLARSGTTIRFEF